MKLKYLALAAAAVVLGSCTDLNVDVKSQYTEYPDNLIAQDAILNNCFYAHRGTWGYWGTGWVMSNCVSGGESIAVSLGTDYYDGGYAMNATLHCMHPGDNTVGCYNDFMGGITTCNKALVSLGLTDTEKVTSGSAQIRTARAFYHFLLMEGWGDTPKLDHLYDDDEPVERVARKEMCEWIESELKAVIDYLPTNVDASTYGRPTRWVADALLAKLYINWAVYTCGDVASYTPSASNAKLNDCIAVCDDLIKSGLFNLNDDYKKRFLPTNGVQIKDFIYAVPYTASNKDGNTYARHHTWRRGQNDGKGGAGLYNIALSNSVGGCFTMNPDFADLFCLKGDRRNDLLYGNEGDGTVYQFGADYEKTDIPTYYKGEAVKMTKTVELNPITDESGKVIPMGPSYDHLSVANNLSGWTQGWHTMKFMLDPSEYNTYSRNSSTDIPVFRYADVLLEKAEAILRGGKATNNDTPQSLMNQIRNSVNAPALAAAPTLQDILDERGRELFDEGWRRNDMIRFGQFEKPSWYIHAINPDAATNTKMRIFPLPTSVLESNTNWKQNPGY